MTPATDRRRRHAAVALVVLTALLLAAAAVTWYARSALVDSEEFTARATAALDNADLRAVLADRVVGELTPGVVPDALAVRPLLVPVVAEAAGSSAFRDLFGRVVAARHRALWDGETSFALSLPLGQGTILRTLEQVAPRVAEAIPAGLRAPVLTLDPSDAELGGARFLDDLTGWRWPLLIAALLAAAACALVAGGVRAALVHLGIAVAGAGLLVAAVVAGLGEFVVAHAANAGDLGDDRERGAVRSLWDAFFGDLADAGLVAALGGAIVAALSATRMPRIELASGRRWARRAATSRHPAARIGRALALIAAGAALVFEPARLGRFAIAVAGVAIALAGVLQLAPRGGRSARIAARRADEGRPAAGRPGETRAAAAAPASRSRLRSGRPLRARSCSPVPSPPPSPRRSCCSCWCCPAPPRSRSPGRSRRGATDRRRCAIAASTRSSSPPRTTLTPPPASPAGSSPTSASGSSASSRTGSAPS